MGIVLKGGFLQIVFIEMFFKDQGDVCNLFGGKQWMGFDNYNFYFVVFEKVRKKKKEEGVIFKKKGG